MASIRMNHQLAELLAQTSRHLDCSETDIVRATAVFIRRGRAALVGHIAVDEMYYRGGGNIVKRYRVAMPDGSPEEFRRILAARCLAELAKPAKPLFRSCLVPGRDYLIEEEN